MCNKKLPVFVVHFPGPLQMLRFAKYSKVKRRYLLSLLIELHIKQFTFDFFIIINVSITSAIMV